MRITATRLAEALTESGTRAANFEQDDESLGAASTVVVNGDGNTKFNDDMIQYWLRRRERDEDKCCGRRGWVGVGEVGPGGRLDVAVN